MQDGDAKERDTHSYIRVSTGRQVWPLDPRPEDISVEDIAHALAMQCRFNGHCLTFYSVAQHSVMVSKVCPPEWARVGLMHDAAEAYLGDMIRPLKRRPLGQGYREAERRLLAVIFAHFKLSTAWADPLPAAVVAADNWMCGREGRMLMPPDLDWPFDLSGAMEPLSPCGPKQAEALFLRRYEELWR